MEKIEYKLHYKNFKSLKTEGVYLIRNLDNNTLKIGITSNLPRRIKEIEGSFKFCGIDPNLKIECFIEYNNNLQLEQFLHEEFKEYNYKNEWFSIDNIDIVLGKLNNFQYQEIDITDIAIQKLLEQNTGGEYLHTPLYYYFIYNYNNLRIYIRSKQDKEYNVVDMIDRIYHSVYGIGNYFAVDYDFDTIYNPIHIKGTEEIRALFDNYDNDILIELSTDLYIPLELYLLNNYKNHILNKFEQAKVNIVDKFNSYSFDYKNNIDNIKNSINEFEDLCVEIQKELNKCIRWKKLQNYKRLG